MSNKQPHGRCRGTSGRGGLLVFYLRLHHRSRKSVDSSKMVKLLHEVYGERVGIDGRRARSVRSTPSRPPISSLSFIGFRYLFSFRQAHRSSHTQPRPYIIFFFFFRRMEITETVFPTYSGTSEGEKVSRTCVEYINRYYEYIVVNSRSFAQPTIGRRRD